VHPLKPRVNDALCRSPTFLVRLALKFKAA
jgi:hypothetical protein